MKKSTKVLGGLFALAIITSTFITSQASAYRGDPTTQGPNYTPERHEEMTKAFENKDYNAWRTLMEQNERKGKILDVVNETNFPKFVEAHNLAQEGKIEESKAIRQELGLGLKDGSGQGKYKNGNGAKQGLRDGSGRNN